MWKYGPVVCVVCRIVGRGGEGSSVWMRVLRICLTGEGIGG